MHPRIDEVKKISQYVGSCFNRLRGAAAAAVTDSRIFCNRMAADVGNERPFLLGPLILSFCGRLLLAVREDGPPCQRRFLRHSYRLRRKECGELLRPVHGMRQHSLCA